MKHDPLLSFEKMVKRLVEGATGRLFSEPRLARQVATRLAHAVEQNAAAGRFPTRYRVILHPDALAALAGPEDALAAHLADYMGNLARQAGHPLPGQPFVELVADSSVPRRDARVKAIADSDDTRVVTGNGLEAPQGIAELDAFFIVNGRRHIPLNKPLLTIGRRMDNDIVIDAPAVSRQHAQVRWRYGRFVLYDAGSRAGLLVNGEPAGEWVLRAGDLITLVEGVSLIYGEGAYDRGTAPARPGAGEQETLAFTRD